MQQLLKTFTGGSFILDMDAHDMRSALRQTLIHVVARGLLPTERREEVERLLWEREQAASTAIGHAVAVPHCYSEAFAEPVIVFVRLAHPINLGAPDGIPTRYLFVLLGPPDRAAEHLDTLASIARVMADEEFRYDVLVARNGEDLVAALKRFRARAEQPIEPAPSGPPEGLRYTGRLFGGMVQDFRRRWRHYASDFRDGLHTKSISSILFLFFACLAPAVTFGGIMAELTGNHIGPIEMILATAVCGVAYALISGQPLIVLGGTGPLLIFTMVLYELCLDLSIPFLETRAWIGIWTGIFLLILAATDASCLMRFFTRFTDEIFAALITLIFIYEAVKAIIRIFERTYQSESISHDVAFLSLILALGTFFIASNLARFRRSRYLFPWMREFLADFGPAIALLGMTIVALVFRGDVSLDRLPAPAEFKPTLETRTSWWIDPFQVPNWVCFAAIGPAILVAVLVYLDQNITARLMNNPDNKLEKGPAYHWDLAIMAFMIAGCSLFGLPWLVAATVRSLNHLRSLATVEEITTGGETRERIIHVREHRVTGLVIHLLSGLALLLLPFLQEIPMAVLYGLFLYMGVVSIAGNQFFTRMSLWLMDRGMYPRTHYVRRVPNLVIHAFTLLQLTCLGLLWLLKESRWGILFPLFIVLLAPIRAIMGRFFSEAHLAALDAEEEPDEEELRWT